MPTTRPDRIAASRAAAKQVFINCPFDADYQRFISDLSGHDIHSHSGEPGQAIGAVRRWLSTASRKKNLPGGADIFSRYQRFQRDLPAVCQDMRLTAAEVTFTDLRHIIATWLRTNR